MERWEVLPVSQLVPEAPQGPELHPRVLLWDPFPCVAVCIFSQSKPLCPHLQVFPVCSQASPEQLAQY